MDYGKIAYLKVCDLETKVDYKPKQTVQKKIVARGENMIATGVFSSNKVEILASDNAECLVDVFVELNATESGKATVAIKFNNATIESTKKMLQSGTNIFKLSAVMNNLQFEKGEFSFEITFDSVQENMITSYELTLCGTNFEEIEKNTKACFMQYNSFCLAFLEREDKIIVYRLESDIDFSLPYDTFDRVGDFEFAFMLDGTQKRLTYYYQIEDKVYMCEYFFLTKQFNTSYLIVEGVEQFAVCMTSEGQSFYYMKGGKIYCRKVTFTDRYVFASPTLVHFFTSKIKGIKASSNEQFSLVFATNANNVIYYKEEYGEAKRLAIGKYPRLIDNTIYYSNNGNIYYINYNEGTLSEPVFLTLGDELFTAQGILVVRKNYLLKVL